MYRLGVWLIALTLVFNGVMAAADDDMPDAPVVVAQGHPAAVGAADCDGHGDHAAMAAEHGGARHGPSRDHLKCCARCSMVSVLPGVAAVPVALAWGAAVFYTAPQDLVGRPVALDPHIPKPLV